MTELQQSLSKCSVKGDTLFLPPISDGPLSNYNEVRTALLKAGAKYKRNAFVFPNEAQPYIDRLMGGESVNIQKEFQFFATPEALADKMVALANIEEGDIVLEPSAGQGAIIKAIYRAFPRTMNGPNDKPSVAVDYYELMELNQKILSDKVIDKSRTSFLGPDFLADSEPLQPGGYHKIVANPPFTKNKDIDHIYQMYKFLRLGGTIVTIASLSWTFGSQKKQVQFREWLKEINAHWEELPENTFKESGTSVRTVLIMINK
jgi:hypothetical protein